MRWPTVGAEMPLAESIPTAYVVSISALLTGYIAYQSRLNSLETEWDREKLVNARLEGKTMPADSWAITVDNILVLEKSGYRYRLTKFLTGGFEGKAFLTIRYVNATLSDKNWEQDAAKEFLEMFDFEVTHLETNNDFDPAYSKFELSTTDWESILEFIDTLVELDKWMKGKRT